MFKASDKGKNLKKGTIGKKKYITHTGEKITMIEISYRKQFKKNENEATSLNYEKKILLPV